METGVQNKQPSPNLSQRERLLEMLIEALPELLQTLPNAQIKEVVTLRVFADEYSNWVKQNRSAAYHTSVVISLNHLTNFLGKQRSIQSMGLKDLENFITDLQQKVKKGYVVYYRNLKAAFNKAKDWGYIKENYLSKVKLPKRQKTAPAYIDSYQLSVICDRLEESSKQSAVGSKQKENSVVKDIVVFAFYTGMRLNEIVNLTWRNVDLTTWIITVGDESFTTKGRNQRYIPVCEEVFEILERIENAECRIENEKQTEDKKLRIIKLNKDSLATNSNRNKNVFCKSNGESFTGDYVSKKFKKACKDAGIDNAIHFHSLRHSFASNLAQKGVSLYVIKELLGHSSISTTEIYSHLNMDSLREAIKMFDTSTALGTGVRGEKREVKGETRDGHSIPQIITIQKFNEKNGGL